MAMPVDVQPGQAVRPPRVRFETRAVENGVAEGRVQFKDVDFVLVTPPGAYSEFEGIASEWIERQRREPYHEILVRAYEAFKAGKEPPMDGTPIEQCTLFTPAEIATIKTVGCRTVDDLAAWPDGNLGIFGMGAVRFKQKAQAWMRSAQNVGASAAEIDKLKGDLETERANSAELRDQLRGLAARLEALEGPRQKLSLKKGEAA